MDEKAVMRQRGVQVADRGGNVDALRDRLGEQRGVDRRVEQREVAADALEVQAVAQLEQAVSDGVPVPEQLVVGGDAEVQRPTGLFRG